MSRFLVPILVALAALVAVLAVLAVVVSMPARPSTYIRLRLAEAEIPGSIHHTFDLWESPSDKRAVLSIDRGAETVLYVAGEYENWTTFTRTGIHGAWQRSTVPSSQVPTLLPAASIEPYFVRLAHATSDDKVGFGTRDAVVFTSRHVTWPYQYGGPVTVWADATTFAPLQFRMYERTASGPKTVITKVTVLQNRPTSELSRTFFQTPDEQRSWSARLVAWMRHLARLSD